MAAYAAVVSLKNTIEQIQNHPHPPISLCQEQVESLTKIITFLQEYLESYSLVENSIEAQGLESRIADAAYAAEDMIESYVVDQILDKMMSSVDFHEGLSKMIHHMDSVKKLVMNILEEEKRGIHNNLHRNPMISSPRPSRSLSSSSSSSVQASIIFGFDDLITETLDKLIREKSSLQIIQLIGMGGIGKTALARTIYEKQMVVDYFDIRGWVTISQDYSIIGLLLELLQEDEGNLSQIEDEDDLGVRLYKKLSGRRYLIIIDDIWDDQVWNHLKFYFPKTQGSRLLFTSRLSNLASLNTNSNSHSIKIHFLDKHNSWNMFCKIVFGKQECPQELDEIGRKIAESCKGLPLSISVIGGLLAKSKKTQSHWQYVAENFNSIVNLEDDEYCLQILAMSYNSLPVYLKPCFLYMGFFVENINIPVSGLIKFWVAEGFIKPDPRRSSSLEEVAEKNLEELIDRNLAIVVKRNIHGKLRYCRIHNLLRDLCLREVRKQKFLFVIGEHGLNLPQDLLSERRICIQGSGRNMAMMNTNVGEIFDSLRASAVARSLIWEHDQPHSPTVFKLLRLFAAGDTLGTHLLPLVFNRVNLRYVNIRLGYYDLSWRLHSKFSFLWNLQTLIVRCRSSFSLPSEIWNMSRLRNVVIWEAIKLPDPPNNAVVVLENLQEFLHISNFKCSQEMVMRIPNIKRLKVSYDEDECVKGSSAFCFHNLVGLSKLESFVLRSNYVPRDARFLELSFPHSLKKLTLEYTFLQWENMTTKIGSLPLLQDLKLKYDSFVGAEWETVQGQFVSLKLLVIDRCHDLESWLTCKTHFPRLEHLILRGLQKLKEIPLEIGEIATLKSIQLVDCSDSSVYSVNRIRDEQEEYGNMDLQLHIPSQEEDGMQY